MLPPMGSGRSCATRTGEDMTDLGFPLDERREEEGRDADGNEPDSGPQDPDKSDQEEADEQAEESFPASDPPAW